MDSNEPNELDSIESTRKPTNRSAGSPQIHQLCKVRPRPRIKIKDEVFLVGICTQKCYDDGVSFPKGKREKKRQKEYRKLLATTQDSMQSNQNSSLDRRRKKVQGNKTPHPKTPVRYSSIPNSERKENEKVSCTSSPCSQSSSSSSSNPHIQSINNYLISPREQPSHSP
jgi:hypothetical protein